MPITTTTEIMGGLGNQLFQIFNLLAYSFRHNTTLYFSPEPIHHGVRKTTYWSTPFLQALNYFVKPAPPNNQPIMYHERNFHYEEPQAPPVAVTTNQTIKFFGYFQSYKYFQDQQELIYRFINLRETQAAMREKTQDKYAYDNTVALHFRVGDYKNLPNHHPLMSLEYYTTALTQLLAASPTTSSTVLYFCEQADQAYVQEKMLQALQQNPLFQNKFTFQCIDHQLTDWEQVLVMSLCRHHIIANSTFSWWGAYMGGYPARSASPQPPIERNGDCIRLTEIQGGAWGVSPHVYYPSTWFGPAMGNKNLADLFPEHWHKIII